MLRICTLCARGGSKGVKNKNLRLINNKPLLAYSLYHAKASKLFSAIAVSSDSEAILELAHQYGASHLIRRPAELATDQAAKIPAIQHCVAAVEKEIGRTCDTVVDLDATSPLRFVTDIQGSVDLLEKENATNVITASPARRSPYFNLIEIDENGAPHLSKKMETPVVRRQDAPASYDMNASIYVWRRNSLFEQTKLFLPSSRVFLMPEERSLDIDSEFDFELVSHILANRRDFEF